MTLMSGSILPNKKNKKFPSDLMSKNTLKRVTNFMVHRFVLCRQTLYTLFSTTGYIQFYFSNLKEDLRKSSCSDLQNFTPKCISLNSKRF